MKVIKSQRKENTVYLEIEIPHDTLEESFNSAFKKVVKKAKVSGFRPGKVPRNIFEKHYGKAPIIQEGISLAMNQCYLEAIKTEDLQVVDYPQNINTDEYKENEPVRFTCEVTVKPLVKLSKYKGLKLTQDKAESIEDRIEEKLQQLREQMASYETVTRAIVKEDIIRVNMKASTEGQSIESWTRDNMAVKVGSSQLGEGFDTEVVGMKTDDKKSISLAYEDSFSNKEVAGKTIDMEFKVMEVREKILPDLDDKFANKVSECQTIVALRDKIKDQINEQYQKESDEKLKSSLMELMIEKTKVELPEAMIKNEVKYDLQYYQDQLKKSGGTMESYLKIMGKSQEEFEEELKEGAKKRVMGELILDEIAKQEKIAVSQSEKREKVQELLPNLKTDAEIDAHMQKIDLNGFNAMLVKQKTMDFLIQNAKIEQK